jgi:hypothetical protein
MVSRLGWLQGGFLGLPHFSRFSVPYRLHAFGSREAYFCSGIDVIVWRPRAHGSPCGDSSYELRLSGVAEIGIFKLTKIFEPWSSLPG